MPNPIPASLASYISACLTPSNAHSATLLTSTLSTPSPWLTLRFVYAAIYGVEDDGSSGSLPPSGGGGPRRSAGGQPGVSSSSSSSIGGSPVILVSLLRPLALWVEIGKKLVRKHSLFLEFNLSPMPHPQPLFYPYSQKIKKSRDEKKFPPNQMSPFLKL